MKPPGLQPQATPLVLPQWAQIPKVHQQALIQILSEMIRRQVAQEARDEPQQDS